MFSLFRLISQGPAGPTGEAGLPGSKGEGVRAEVFLVCVKITFIRSSSSVSSSYTCLVDMPFSYVFACRINVTAK